MNSRGCATTARLLASLRRPAIIDEIQNAPDLFNYLRTLWMRIRRPKDASCSPDRKKRR